MKKLLAISFFCSCTIVSDFAFSAAEGSEERGRSRSIHFSVSPRGAERTDTTDHLTAPTERLIYKEKLTDLCSKSDLLSGTYVEDIEEVFSKLEEWNRTSYLTAPFWRLRHSYLFGGSAPQNFVRAIALPALIHSQIYPRVAEEAYSADGKQWRLNGYELPNQDTLWQLGHAGAAVYATLKLIHLSPYILRFGGEKGALTATLVNIGIEALAIGAHSLLKDNQILAGMLIGALVLAPSFQTDWQNIALASMLRDYVKVPSDSNNRKKTLVLQLFNLKLQGIGDLLARSPQTPSTTDNTN